MSIRIKDIKSEISSTDSSHYLAVDSETSGTSRIKVDSLLSAETTARSNSDTILQNNIDAETEVRTLTDTNLQSSLSSLQATHNLDISNANDNISSVQSSLLTEIGIRLSADNTLQSNINLKVDKVTNKQLSELDFTSAIKATYDQMIAATTQHTALFDLLINGNLDEQTSTLNIDLNNSLLRIGVL